MYKTYLSIHALGSRASFIVQHVSDAQIVEQVAPTEAPTEAASSNQVSASNGKIW